MNRRFSTLILIGFACLALSGCDSLMRSNDAAIAREKMIGLSKEQVLACMGIPQHKAHEGATEVWAYKSTNGSYDSTGAKRPMYGTTFSRSHGEHSFCTINVVMTNNVVSAVHYNGPRSSFLAPDEQCGFGVEHCAE
jgi:hypothetical protein